MADPAHEMEEQDAPGLLEKISAALNLVEAAGDPAVLDVATLSLVDQLLAAEADIMAARPEVGALA